MEIIKRSGYIADVPLQKKLSVLENIYRQADNTYSVHELCEALDIARGTFYNYIFRRADHSKREEAQIELMRLVQQVFDDSSQRFGAEKIRVTLAGSGVRVSTKRIAAIMQELGLQSIRPDAKKQYKKQQQYKKQNLLERQFTADHPNQIWVSDITYFKVNDYWMYLCIILDLFSRRIVDYRVSRNASTNLVTSTFRTAFRERGNPREALIKSVAVDGERFFVKTRFEKRRNTVCTREGHARIRMAPLSPTAATYFSFFKPPDWQKRSVVRGRGFIQRFPSSLTFHSDRGKQYTSAAFTALLQKCGVKQSFSATARPHDNAVAETFFASFKKEEAYRREYTSEQSYRKRVEQYIQFYNELRPHRTLKYKTPQAIEETYQERL